MPAQRIRSVSHQDVLRIIESRSPRGLFIEHLEDGSCVGIDNTTGDAWTEDFPDTAQCFRWLTKN